MAELLDSRRVAENVRKLYEIRKAKLYALAISYAARALNIFRQEQGEQTFWENQTNQANSRMFAKAFVNKSDIGFFMSHGVLYGVYLELANDRKNEAIRPIMMVLAPQFLKDAKEVINSTVSI